MSDFTIFKVDGKCIEEAGVGCLELLVVEILSFAVYRVSDR